MKQYKLREHLLQLSRSELEDISERIYGDRNSNLKSKDALISVLVKKNHRVAKLLGLKESWWATYHNHVYGLVGLASLIITLIVFIKPWFGTNKVLDPLHYKEAHDLVLRELSEPYSSEEVFFPKEPLKERVLVKKDDMPGPTTNESEFELIEHVVVTDLRSYKEILDSDDLRTKTSPVVQRIRQEIKKSDISPAVYRLKGYTSGIDVYSDSITHRDEMKVYESEGLKEKIDNRYIVKPRILEFDISDTTNGDNEVLLKISKTYWNAFQDDKQSWVGVSVGIPTRSITFLVLFPKDKPYSKFEHFVNRNQKRIDSYNENYVLEDPDKEWIWWKIENPQTGHGYNIDWDW